MSESKSKFIVIEIPCTISKATDADLEEWAKEAEEELSEVCRQHNLAMGWPSCPENDRIIDKLEESMDLLQEHIKALKA